MHNVLQLLVCGMTVLSALSTASGQEFATELQLGRNVLNQLAAKPENKRQVFAEVTVADKVVGYMCIRIEAAGRGLLRTAIEAVIQTPDMRISGGSEAESGLKLQPKRITFRRNVQQPDGKTMTQQWTVEAKDGKLKVASGEGDLQKAQTKPLPEEPFFFSVDLLAARSQIGLIGKPFALVELDPLVGEPRLLVFRPSTEQDGTRVITIFVNDKKHEATYRFSKNGKLLSWSEAGAPAVMKVVDERRGKALAKQFSQPQPAGAAGKPQ